MHCIERTFLYFDTYCYGVKPHICVPVGSTYIYRPDHFLSVDGRQAAGEIPVEEPGVTIYTEFLFSNHLQFSI